ncbi:MAG: hypothetical protein Q9166_003781 [cf. Caloplaca sp. 2 TL-2023]
MARPAGQKRQAAQADVDSDHGSRRTRSKTTEETKGCKRATRSSDQSISTKKKIVKKGIARSVKKNTKSTYAETETKPSMKAQIAAKEKKSGGSLSKVALSKGTHCGNDVTEALDEDDSDEPSYWLLKAEPDSRIEKGKDVRFSIDDLKDAVKPEAWDGKLYPGGMHSKCWGLS